MLPGVCGFSEIGNPNGVVDFEIVFGGVFVAEVKLASQTATFCLLWGREQDVGKGLHAWLSLFRLSGFQSDELQEYRVFHVDMFHSELSHLSPCLPGALTKPLLLR